MKTAKLTLMFLACTAAIPAFAQNTTDSRCGMTNFDRSQNMYTIVNPAPGTATQQCFITVVPKDSWTGGMPDLASSQLVEGNYDIALSGGGGGGGGAAGRKGGGGHDGGDAVPFRDTRYLAPGVYRLTVGAGGQGGQACMTREQGGRGSDGGPTSLTEAYSGKVIAGYSGAESWDGRYAGSYQVASGGRVTGASSDANMTRAARRGEAGGGGRGSSRDEVCDAGHQGGGGYIKLALADVPQPARMQVQPAQPAPAAAIVTTPAPEAARPARRDRN